MGKTTLALTLLGKEANEKHPGYFNWDNPKMAAQIRALELPSDQKILVFDEIHKYGRWSNLIKGIYDTEKFEKKF